MQAYIYLSLIPEALVLSQLPPAKFGSYLATGSKRQIEGPAIFFEVDSGADLGAFRLAEARERCIPHEDGSPRCSVYVSIFNVLPRVPLGALLRAYLTTPAGLTLELGGAPWQPGGGDSFYLYQELGPVYPRVVSSLDPRDFCRLVTAPEKLISLPRIAFIDLNLGPLARDPDATDTSHLPYQSLAHLRECLRAVRDSPERKTKIVNRGLRPDILFYLIRSGLFVGDGTEIRWFPIPSEDDLEMEHLLWWHSARAAKSY
jgi:hypothetical protein